jgi:hypothetical protein
MQFIIEANENPSGGWEIVVVGPSGRRVWCSDMTDDELGELTSELGCSIVEELRRDILRAAA